MKSVKEGIVEAISKQVELDKNMIERLIEMLYSV